ncbi:hypothetical protein FVEG_06545 [Fusarium verticillioides 7600]|uniref:SnoaL-like domain-containing protein n=1 Tax=Gibberella moniliformis (strain M3125 / FGSC 7600) TaxID=334819 RepID=W7ME73_GIBM7|nr:hypothetical protein FVEG_06545 [Fusarium verticillioides 7600]EWG45904.1 hypothetical protein FVEG_06545 [Fusarium verticillioides 7600]RBQ77262.1 hypothetical protein FVER14953_06545 [Fusarium verticillioides]RBQ88728.1 hypothetical protein FVER53263_06545 [Fusarium verticillioides]RBR12962.1 hypothetical protein FVER53590_06545 [Fusarium verticillioides]
MSHSQAIHRFVEFINSADATIGNEFIHESAEFHVPFDEKPLKGVSGYLEMLGMMRAAFPDIQWSVEQIITEGDKVVLRSKTRGTQTGPFMGFAPSGKGFEIVGMNLFTFANGKIVKEQGLPDLFGILVQIGAVKIPL